MGEQAERMSRLVDDLLSLSRVEMREYLPLADEADLGAVLAEVAADAWSRWQSGPASASRCRPATARPSCAATADELTQVFQNLVQNAIKYGRDGRQGRGAPASASRRPRPSPAIRVDVIDDGPGIAPQHLPRLTERFYRVNVAASREKGGTGLGLAIVKHILNRHRGELVIISKLGRGIDVLGHAAVAAG